MHIGVVCPLTDAGVGAVELARALEERGIESLFLPEHTHVPVAWAEANPAFPGPETPHFRMVDPFVALAAAAAVTERLRLGTGVCLVVQHDPITLAKTVATLDRLSGGRVVLGVGAGWNPAEMADHGTAFATRTRLLGERVRAMQAIWTDDRAAFHGELVDFDPIYQWPKPVQQPVPVLVGGNGPTVLERVVAYADGWLPQLATGQAAEIADRVAELRALAVDRGRSVSVTAFGAAPNEEALAGFAELGVERCVVPLLPGPWDDMLATLDRYAALAAGL